MCTVLYDGEVLALQAHLTAVLNARNWHSTMLRNLEELCMLRQIYFEIFEVPAAGPMVSNVLNERRTREPGEAGIVGFLRNYAFLSICR